MSEVINGKLLEEAVHKFITERNEQNLLRLFAILSACNVWIPCNVVLSDEDQKRFEELMNKKSDPTEMVGQEFTAKDEIHLLPDILQKDGKYFFPIFSSEEVMGDYGKRFTRVEKNILEVLPLARNNEMKPAGIVLNAFSEPFIIPEKLYPVIEKAAEARQKEQAVKQ